MKAMCALLLCGALAGASPVSRGEAMSEPSLLTSPTAPPPGTDIYEVDPQTSSVQVLVYRSGELAKLGHNHVVTVLGLSGRVWIDPAATNSGFELSFPITQLLVDDPGARGGLGPDFPPVIPEADRAGTRRNMLRPQVLDADRYPTITVRSLAVTGPVQAPHLTARITIKDVSHDLALTPLVQVDGAQLTASGEFDIYQSDFGIRPFAVLLGSLEVQDRLHVKFSVSAARRQDAAAPSQVVP